MRPDEQAPPATPRPEAACEDTSPHLMSQQPREESPLPNATAKGVGDRAASPQNDHSEPHGSLPIKDQPGALPEDRYAQLGRACEANGLAGFGDDGAMWFEPPRDLLTDKIEGLDSDLFEAVGVAYRRGAVEWTRLNYPDWFERLKVGGGQPANSGGVSLHLIEALEAIEAQTVTREEFMIQGSLLVMRHLDRCIAIASDALAKATALSGDGRLFVLSDASIACNAILSTLEGFPALAGRVSAFQCMEAAKAVVAALSSGAPPSQKPDPIEPRGTQEPTKDRAGALPEDIGFTATREGLTTPQVRALAGVMAALDGAFHHGCCIGGDTAAHNLALAMRLPIHGHPGIVPDSLRARVNGFAVLHPPKPPLERNEDIVTACGRLIGCPRGMTEERRSGTWATIRKARAIDRYVIIVWPNGSVTHEFPGRRRSAERRAPNPAESGANSPSAASAGTLPPDEPSSSDPQP